MPAFGVLFIRHGLSSWKINFKKRRNHNRFRKKTRSNFSRKNQKKYRSRGRENKTIKKKKNEPGKTVKANAASPRRTTNRRILTFLQMPNFILNRRHLSVSTGILRELRAHHISLRSESNSPPSTRPHDHRIMKRVRHEFSNIFIVVSF